MQDPAVPFDLYRMVFGHQSIAFLLEILVRVVVIYSYTLVLLRWIGGRSVAQLSIIEFLLVIALGSAVGDSLFYPEVPLLHAMVVITVVVAIDKFLDTAIQVSRTFKKLVDGNPIEIVRDGCLVTEGAVNGIGGLELMELLRMRGIENLGQVHRAYLESNGQISVFLARPPRPGLAIVPPHEIAVPAPPEPGEAACCVLCGQMSSEDADACSRCGGQGRTAATTAPQLLKAQS